jgi:hypothetical protein
VAVIQQLIRSPLTEAGTRARGLPSFDATLVLWVSVWIVTRLFIVVQVGFWNDVNGPQYQDINFFEATSDHLATAHTMPDGDSWQYPPLAAFLLLVPRLFPSYPISFILLMLAVDLTGFVLLARRSLGLTPVAVWSWLLLLPMLADFPVLRFDLVPTVTVMVALLVLDRRPLWFGVVVGIGFMVKLWPIVALLAQWNRRRMATAIGGVLGVTVLSFVAAAAFFGDQSGFWSNQSTRGLQVESVGATPWQLRQMITGRTVKLAQRNGTLEVPGHLADSIVRALHYGTFAAILLVLVWFLARDRLIHTFDRQDLTSIALGRDAAFAATLLALSTNPVLSPQFLMWTIGLAAITLGSPESRLKRPGVLVAIVVILTFGLYQSPAILVMRNTMLVIATVDCWFLLTRALVARAD